MPLSSRYTKWLPALIFLTAVFIIAIYIHKSGDVLQIMLESFVSSSTSTSTSTGENENENKNVATIAEQEKYLLEQIKADPNKTNLDKDVMADLTQQYFSSSNTLPLLRSFNDRSQEANPIPGDQLIRDILKDYSKTS